MMITGSLTKTFLVMTYGPGGLHGFPKTSIMAQIQGFEASLFKVHKCHPSDSSSATLKHPGPSAPTVPIIFLTAIAPKTVVLSFDSV
jgi:hypothetical protein